MEETGNLGSSWGSNQSTASTSASAVRTPSTVNQVSAVRFEEISTRLGTPPQSYDTVTYDMTELDSDPGEFSLEGLNIMMVRVAKDPEHYLLDSSDGDDEWTYSPEAAEEELKNRASWWTAVPTSRWHPFASSGTARRSRRQECRCKAPKGSRLWRIAPGPSPSPRKTMTATRW